MYRVHVLALVSEADCSRRHDQSLHFWSMAGGRRPLIFWFIECSIDRLKLIIFCGLFACSRAKRMPATTSAWSKMTPAKCQRKFLLRKVSYT